MMTNMDTLKKELKYVQETLIRSIQAISRVSMSESKSEQVIDKRLGDILDTVESACVTARCVIDRYRIMKPFSENGKKEKIISKVAGEIEVTAELFCMNMIPSVPLDGGILLKKIIAYRLGYNSANKIMTVISAVFSAMIMGLGIYVMYITKFNFSVLLFSALMIGNIFTQSEKYNVDLTKTLMFNNKKKKSVRHIVVENECNYCDIVDKFIPKDYNVVYIVSDDGKVKDIITETQVIDKLTTEQVL